MPDELVNNIQKYRKRTKLGLQEARDALRNELGMDIIMYGQIKERLAFSLFSKPDSYDFNQDIKDAMFLINYDLSEWRRFKRNDDPWAKQVVKYFYDLADEVIKLNDIVFDPEDPRNEDL